MRAARGLAREHDGRLASLLPAMAMAIVVLLLTATSVAVTDRTHAEGVRHDVEARADSIGRAVTQSLASHAAITNALAAWATSSLPEPADFQAVADRLLQVQEGVRALEIAPGGVITYVHPLEGNEAAVGLDLNVHSSGAMAMQRLRAGDRILVEGPIDLVQGGRAAILRARIDFPESGVLEGDLWGVAINVVDVDALLAASGLADVDGLQWGLNAGVGAVSSTPLVAGVDIAQLRPVEQSIAVPGGEWTLHLQPAGGWPTSSPSRTLLILSGLALAAALAALTYVLRREPRRLRHLVTLGTAEIEQSHQRTRAVMNAAGDAILAINEHGDVVDWNPAASRLLRLVDAELRGRPIDAHLELSQLTMEDTGDGSPTGRGLLEVQRGDGSGFPAEVCVAWSTASPVRAVVIRDVTEQQRQHEDLRRHALELERLSSEQMAIDALKRDFMQMASHEVRTPITAIRGFALTLNRHWDQLADEDRRRSLEVIHRQATRLWQLLNNILMTSQLEGGALERRIESVHVATVITAALTESQVPSTTVKIDCPPALTASVDGDHLGRVLVALLTNAQKYGSSPINIVATTDGSDLVVRVTDHGQGVPFSFRSRLFEPFSQASTGVRREAIGTGLGLAVARGLARANGGDVWHEDHPGVGATFALRFPRNTRGEGVDPSRRIAAPNVVDKPNGARQSA